MRRLRAVPLLVLLLVGLAVPAAQRPATPARHVVLISIDGMRPASYLEAGPAKIPTLRTLKASGAWASQVWHSSRCWMRTPARCRSILA